MAQIFEDDQKPRMEDVGNLSPDDFSKRWAEINKQDTARRDQVRQMLDRGELHTGKDFERAAFIMQHGATPADYLMAHTLAVIAVAKGDSKAMWIATATLDRYLQAIGQPQIYGTQYGRKPVTAPWTQEPYDRTLISDELRRQLGVPAMEKQAERLKKMNATD